MKKVMSPIERAELEIAEMERESAGQEPATVADTSKVIVDALNATTPEPPRQEEQPKDDYYQRWKSLEGIVKSKDTQLHQMIEQNTSLMQRVESLINATNQAPAPLADSSTDLKSHLGALYEKFGDDMIDAMSVVSQATTGKDMEAMKAYVTRLEQRLESLDATATRVEEKQNTSDSAQFMADLLRVVPDFQQLLSSQRFVEWAERTEVPYSDMTFKDLYIKSNADWNFKGIVGVFTAFKEQDKAPAPIVDPRLAQITPNSAGSAPAPLESGGQKVWTETEIDAFYQNATRGKYSDAEYTRIEREIDNANRMGLVSPG